VAESSPEQKKSTSKRLVRNPETFRERALKAAKEGDRPRKRSRVRGAFAKVLRPIFRPLGRLLSRIGKTPPMRLLGRILFPRYIRGSVNELRQVEWPSKRESRDLTFAVLVFAVTFGLFVFVVDLGLDKLFKQVLIR
jgi:preprotein translocase SecE subunit